MFFEVTKYLKLRDKLWLLIGSIVHRIVKNMPSHVFEIRNLVETLKKENFIIEEQGAFLNIKRKENSFKLRKKSSDLKVFRQIWINEEFKQTVTLIKQNQIKISTILDAGANIGLSTVYLKKHFPKAQVVCIEPDKSNIIQLQHNIQANCLRNCTVIKGGLWSHKTWLDMDYSLGDGLEWSRALKPSTNGSIPVFGLEDVMQLREWKSIDLLKMDIEGAEDIIFSENLSFLEKVKVFTIEVHDMVNTGHRVVEALSSYNFRVRFSGELVIGISKQFGRQNEITNFVSNAK